MKSHVSIFLSIVEDIFKDASAKCDANLPFMRDLITIRSRAEHEGLSFFTITLPDFGKDFEKSIEAGFIAPTDFRSFKKSARAPAFLRGFLELVFDMQTGRILDEPSVSAIEGIRQIAYTFKKVKMECSARRIAKAFANFIETDRSLSVLSAQEYDVSDFNWICRRIWNPLFYGFNHRVGVPKHGPGATAEGISGNRKYTSVVWHDRLEQYFPLFHTRFPNENAYGSREFKLVTIIPEEQEQPVRVIAVPKTLRTPRIIAIEPVCMQYTQQQLSREIVTLIQNYWLTKGHINFSDQTVNQQLALEASKTRNWSTLDLSDASDRVPNSMVRYMFQSNPDLLGAIDACRSRRANVHVNGIEHTVVLNKFSSMGSALCFPVESMYFYTLCILGYIRGNNLPVTWASILEAAKHVYVYGDDIIVPRTVASAVSNTLTSFGCKVNSHKSFTNSNFRESCGVDAFNGYNVSPCYIRQLAPRNRRESAQIISWVETSNLFYKKGYWKTATRMMNICESILGKLPIAGEKTSGLAWFSFQRKDCVDLQDEWRSYYEQNSSRCQARFSSRRHILEYRMWCPAPVYREDRVEGYAALMKYFINSYLECDVNDDSILERESRSVLRDNLSLQPSLVSCRDGDRNHNERSVRHGAVTLKLRWARPY